MISDGYAAVTARRVAAGADVNVGLVYYYFETMDDLFIALFRRSAEASLQRQVEALSSSQPLWGLWDLTHHQSSPAVTNEFIALANHRKAIRSEIADYSRRFRTMQLEMLSEVLDRYGIDAADWPPVSLILMMTGISRFLLVEEEFGLETGHAETVALIERHIAALEGPRREGPAEAMTHGTSVSF